jgi:hypothetical protein
MSAKHLKFRAEAPSKWGADGRFMEEYAVFSLYPENSLEDWFRRTASTTTQSARTAVVSGS